MITAHELTHALEDQHFDLDGRLQETIDDDDRMFAISAVHEGSAMVLMSLFSARRLASDGVLLFSNHLKRFRMDHEAVHAAGLELEDISRQTLPRDFARNPRSHHCWRIRHRSCGD